MKADSTGKPRPFVFLDPHGKRWPRLRLRLFVLGVLVFAAVVWFVAALFVNPELRLPRNVLKIKGQLRAALQQRDASNIPAKASWRKYYPAQPAQEHPRPVPRARKHAEVHLGFYSNWDANSYTSLLQHASLLTHLCPNWMTLVDGKGTLRMDADDRGARVAAAKGIVLMPMLNNLVEDKWLPEAVENLVNGPPENREKFILNVLSRLQEAKAGGVVVNWEQIDPAYKKNTAECLKKLAAGLHAVDKELWLMVPMGDEINAFDLDALAGSVDRFVAMLYDENAETDAPGPIASQDWFEGWLSVVLAYGEPSQWVVAIGAFGYDWTSGSKKAETISFADAMSRASYAGVKNVEVQAPSYNAEYSFSEPGGEHTVVFLDAITFLNQLNAARNAGVGGIGIGRLGTEDPQIWDVLATPNSALFSPETLAKLRVMKASETITSVGRGEIITVDDDKDDGVREVKMDKDNWRVLASYSDDPDPKRGFPTYPVLYHQGAGGEREVVLTFDDGPDPKWTPQVLDILKARGVKAAFFVVGKQAEAHPGLLRRIVNEGHEIGNHTYTHANLAEVSEPQIRLELNGTQWLIESITGRSTILFRPPYNADSRPSRMEELRPLKFIQDELNYLIVMENIDPEDWSKPGADTIVQRVKDLRGQGSIILLHDAGGSREQTVEALPKIIDYLQTRGDRIVTLSDLLHIPRDELMPPASGRLAPLTMFVTGLGFRAWRSAMEFGWAFMIIATALIVLRTVIVAVLASVHHRAERRAPQKQGDFPPISILIAAYNEGRVIAATLRSVLDTDYPGEIEVLVVNDGSADDTAAVVELAAATEPRIRLISQPNSGKAEALIVAVREARHEILVFLDADTHFEYATLRNLVRPFDDPKVGAVSGHAKVGNLRKFIARCQALEYICGFNLDRRAYAVWNCITVVPGAVSALRKSAIAAAGGFSHDTLAEDTDLTLALHRQRYRIEYAHDAIAHTEAPETVRALARQRFRWAFGTLQCLWKHRDLVFNPQYRALGWFSLPSVWFFQIVLVALTPVVDLLLIVSLVTAAAGTSMTLYFATFLAADVLLAALACVLEGEKLRNAWIILPMRLIYRPLLSWVIWRAILRALKGAWVTWGKLERTASVPVRA